MVRIHLPQKSGSNIISNTNYLPQGNVISSITPPEPGDALIQTTTLNALVQTGTLNALVQGAP